MNFEKKSKENGETAESLREQLEERNARIKELEHKLEEVEKNATTDDLTGLYNRAGLKKAAKLVMPEALSPEKTEQRGGEQKNKPVGMMMLDIDHFKEINDTYGHLEGDRIIKEAANFLTGSMRKNDVVARLGGDEFVVILNGANEKIINKFFDPEAEPKRPRFGFTTTIGGDEKRISFSGGVTLTQPNETIDDFQGTIDRADKALYASKEAGRDRITMFDASTESSLVADSSANKAKE